MIGLPDGILPGIAPNSQNLVGVELFAVAGAALHIHLAGLRHLDQFDCGNGGFGDEILFSRAIYHIEKDIGAVQGVIEFGCQ